MGGGFKIYLLTINEEMDLKKLVRIFDEASAKEIGTVDQQSIFLIVQQRPSKQLNFQLLSTNRKIQQFHRMHYAYALTLQFQMLANLNRTSYIC
jgi:hypothetical protein